MEIIEMLLNFEPNSFPMAQNLSDFNVWKLDIKRGSIRQHQVNSLICNQLANWSTSHLPNKKALDEDIL